MKVSFVVGFTSSFFNLFSFFLFSGGGAMTVVKGPRVHHTSHANNISLHEWKFLIRNDGSQMG